MLFKDFVVAKNRHLTVYERNRVNKLFDDKPKRMPDDLREELSNIEIAELIESTGLTIVVLNCGKTSEELDEDKKAVRRSVKNACNKIVLTTAMAMASLPFGADIDRWRY